MPDFTHGVQMRKIYLPTQLFILLSVISFSVWPQANSDYLKSLEGEASGLELDKQTKSPPKQIQRVTQPSGISGGNQVLSGAIEDLIPGLSIDQFEQVLKHNYIGSYLFYKRLTDVQRDLVFKFYQGNPDPEQVRKKILQVSKK